TIEALFQ
nr:Chain B, 2BC peptide TIEALFQ [Enterovirus A71]